MAEYANAMKSGEWKYNGESIKVCTDGSLLDGQHRLEACIESGVTFDTLLVTNLRLRCSRASMLAGSARA